MDSIIDLYAIYKTTKVLKYPLLLANKESYISYYLTSEKSTVHSRLTDCVSHKFQEWHALIDTCQNRDGPCANCAHLMH